jgi:hypothetical protein
MSELVERVARAILDKIGGGIWARKMDKKAMVSIWIKVALILGGIAFLITAPIILTAMDR